MERNKVFPVLVVVTSRFAFSLLRLEKMFTPVIVVNNVEAEEIQAGLALLKAKKTRQVEVLNAGYCSYGKALAMGIDHADTLGFSHVITVDRLDGDTQKIISLLRKRAEQFPQSLIQSSPYDSRKVWPLSIVMPFLKKYGGFVGFEVLFSVRNQNSSELVNFSTPYRQLPWEEKLVGFIKTKF